jgi:glucosamine-6-phosphate deaminase
MPRWERRTVITCPNACYDREGYKQPMHLIVTRDYDMLSQETARLVAKAIKAKPDAAIVVPSGNTPTRFYRELVALYGQGEFETTHLRVFQLDEYLGIPSSDEHSFYGWIKRTFLDPMHIPEEHVVRLRGEAPDPWEVCREYDAAVQNAGGFDIALQGLGRNGHLGFNEPPADPQSFTHVVELTEETQASNARYWDGRERIPGRAITCAMAQLLAARQVIVLVSGEQKRDILRRTLEGPVTPEVPASYLQTRSSVSIIADALAWPQSVPGEIRAV